MPRASSTNYQTRRTFPRLFKNILQSSTRNHHKRFKKPEERGTKRRRDSLCKRNPAKAERRETEERAGATTGEGTASDSDPIAALQELPTTAIAANSRLGPPNGARRGSLGWCAWGGGAGRTEGDHGRCDGE